MVIRALRNLSKFWQRTEYSLQLGMDISFSHSLQSIVIDIEISFFAMNVSQKLQKVFGQDITKTIERVFIYGTLNLCHEDEFASIINEFFATAGERVSPELGYSQSCQLDVEAETVLNEFPLMSVSDFLEILDEFKAFKPSGIVDLTSTLITDTMQAIQEIYTKLCNCSLISRKFPTACNLARISITPKKGVIWCLDNLRPISILSIIDKVLEKFVNIWWTL